MTNNDTVRDFARKMQFCAVKVWVVEVINIRRDGFPSKPIGEHFSKLYLTGKEMYENIEKDGIADYRFEICDVSTNSFWQLAIWE